MEKREIGKSGIIATAMGLGTWAVGGDSGWGPRPDSEISIKAIECALDHGITLVDTAPAYGFGHSEELVAKAIKGRRHDMVLSTKCGLTWTADEGAVHMARDGKVLRRNLSKKSIVQDIEYSLKRLQTDYIDIFITHWQALPEYFTPVGETMQALMALKKEGKIRAVGASNVNADIVREYMQYGQLDLIQERFSMLDRRVDAELLPLCEENQITIQAYSPLEQGLLTGNYTMDTVIKDTELRNKIKWYQPENRARVISMLDGFAGLCEKYDCSLSSLIIAWTIAHSKNMNVLVGGRKSRHVLENIKGGSVVLDKADFDKITADADLLLKNS